MACLRCGSHWVTRLGKDMVSCPGCCKQQRCKARKQGRLPASETKVCGRCGQAFEAVGGNAMNRARHCGECRPQARMEYLGARREKCKKESTRRRRMNRVLSAFMESIVSAMNAQVAASQKCAMTLSNPPSMCQHCSKPFVPDPRRRSRFCSWKCCRLFTETRTCVTCGEVFKLRAMGRNAKTKRRRPECRSCVKVRWLKTPRGRAFSKNQGHRTRCRKYRVPYDSAVKPVLVFERDGYRCHVCKRKTLPKFTWVGSKPHERSPTVDHHPYPLSAGVCGHEWHNVKCCCWGCNVRKGARWDHQLPLIRS